MMKIERSTYMSKKFTKFLLFSAAAGAAAYGAYYYLQKKGDTSAPLKEEENKKRAITIAKSLDPAAKGKEYKGEKYVMAGDVYTNADNVGRCGWSWYTGSASWYRKLLLLIEENRNNCKPFS